MRNFKKILSLVLAMAMMLSVMVVGAGAAFKDEGDFSEEYVTAAEALTNLGVLKGYEDGTFQPKDTITRAETAALIYRMATGDVDDAKTGIYTQMTNGFTDVPNGQWFAGYVNFCANSQYILGMGDGTFGPQKNVTGYQTLAMILRAAGFDKDGEFAGPDWEVKTASFAEKLGVLENVKGSEDLGAPASRELVAELLFAVMSEVELVHYAPFWGYVKQGETLGEMQFELKQVEGVVWANEEANLGQDKNNALEDGKTCIFEGKNVYNYYNLSTGTDIIGEQVTVWVADDTAVSTPISKADTTTEWSNTSIQHLDKDGKDDWNEAKAGHKIYNNYTSDSIAVTGKGIYVKVIDNGAGFDDYVLTEKQTLDTVKLIKNDGKIVFDDQGVMGGYDQFAYEGIAKNDVVLTIAFDGNMFINKADYITGQISKVYEAHGDADDWATINGEKYTQSDIEMYNSTKTGLNEYNDIEETFNWNYNGQNWNYYMDSYGNIKAYEEADADALDYALVLDFDNEDKLFGNQPWVKFLTSDGNVQTMPTEEDYSGFFEFRCFYKGAVVPFKTNDDGKFEIVDKWGYGFDYDFNGKVADIDNEGLVKLTDGNDNYLYEGSDDFVAFYYWNDGRNVYYDVLTGDEALADIEGKKVVQKDADPASSHGKVYGDIYMVNIAGAVSPETEYCYVIDTIPDSIELVDGKKMYYYEAVTSAGEEITVVAEFDNLPAGKDAHVFKYVQHTYNTLADGACTLNVLVPVAGVKAVDLHAHYNNTFIYYDGAHGSTYKGPLKNVMFVNVDDSEYAPEIGAAVELDNFECTGAVMVLDSVNNEALAVFVTDAPDGDDAVHP